MGNESVVTEVVWAEPPGAPRGPGRKHTPIAEELKSKPGKWGRIGPYKDSRMSSQIAYAIRNATLTAYSPKGSFEAVGRSGMVYARYVGESDA